MNIQDINAHDTRQKTAYSRNAINNTERSVKFNMLKKLIYAIHIAIPLPMMDSTRLPFRLTTQNGY